MSTEAAAITPAASRVAIDHKARAARENNAQWVALAGGVLVLAAIVLGILKSSLWSPFGASTFTLGLVLAAAGLAVRYTPKMFTLMRRELAAYFLSPIAYMVLFGILIVAAFNFRLLLYDLSTSDIALSQRENPVTIYLTGIWLLFCLIFVVPIATMRLLSEERRSGTIETLASAPVTEAEVVMGKFLAALLFYMVVWSPWGLFLVVLRWMGNVEFDFWPVVSMYIGLLTLGTTFIAGGLLFSSLTRNQIIAAILAFAMMMVLLVLVVLQFYMRREGVDEQYVEAMRYASFYWQMRDFGQGKLDLRYVVMHLSAAGFLLFVTTRVLESRKWQ